MGGLIEKRRIISNFIVNSPKRIFLLCSKDTFGNSKTIDKVFGMLNEIVEQVSEEHVVQFVTDNAVNYNAAIGSLH